MAFIVSIVGNRRPNNYTAFAAAVVNTALIKSGASVHVFDGREIDLTFPGEASGKDTASLREAIVSADGVVLATPEYHGTFSAYTKLVIENLDYPSVLAGKVVALVGVASGRIGAVKSLEGLRSCCAHCGAIVLPHSISISNVRFGFDEHGRCMCSDTEQALIGVATSLLTFIAAYSP